jgi:two-component system response regulator YesN
MLSLLDQRRSRSGMNHYPPVLSRILFFIHEHYADDLTLATLSDAFQLSRQYIMRLFQKHMHTTVTHYLTQLKMNHALELLRHSSFRINEVADMLGYHNTYYFCRLFRQHFGMTPTEYIRHGMRGEQ